MLVITPLFCVYVATMSGTKGRTFHLLIRLSLFRGGGGESGEEKERRKRKGIPDKDNENYTYERCTETVCFVGASLRHKAQAEDIVVLVLEETSSICLSVNVGVDRSQLEERPFLDRRDRTSHPSFFPTQFAFH